MEGKNKKTIKAPSKILWTLRFRNKCIKCGKIIPIDQIICQQCARGMRRR